MKERVGSKEKNERKRFELVMTLEMDRGERGQRYRTIDCRAYKNVLKIL